MKQGTNGFGLQERSYSVLVVSASKNFNIALNTLLQEGEYSRVSVVTSVSAARRDLAEQSFDYVIVNAPLPDGEGAGTRFSIDAAQSRGTVALLLVKSEIHEEVLDQVTPYGVFTLQKPTSVSTLSLALTWMASARERLRGFEQKTLSIEEKMAEIREVNRAKWLLIRELKMSEPDAHRYIEKTAMDRSVSRREIAREILRTYT